MVFVKILKEKSNFSNPLVTFSNTNVINKYYYITSSLNYNKLEVINVFKSRNTMDIAVLVKN